MAAEVASENNAHHGDLDGTLADTVTLTASLRGFRVWNRATTGVLYYTFATGADAPPAVAVVAAADTYSLPFGQTDTWADVDYPEGVVVSLISAGTDNYSVESW